MCPLFLTTSSVELIGHQNTIPVEINSEKTKNVSEKRK